MKNFRYMLLLFLDIILCIITFSSETYYNESEIQKSETPCVSGPDEPFFSFDIRNKSLQQNYIDSKVENPLELTTLRICGVFTRTDALFFNKTFCKSLNTLYLIESYDFTFQPLQSCPSLKTVTLSPGQIFLKSESFRGDVGLEKVNLPDSIGFIDAYIFIGTAVKELDIPASVKSIHSKAFTGASDLRSINVHPSNEYYSSADGVLFNKSKSLLLKFPEDKTPPGNYYNIPEEVTMISSYSFHRCKNVYYVSTTNVVAIAESAFMESDVRKIKVNQNLSLLETAVFRDCMNLISINIEESHIDKIFAQTFYNCYSLVDVHFPNTLKTIDDEAFFNCQSIRSLTFPDTVATIGSRTFSGNKGLTDIVFPKYLEVIQNESFRGCSKLSNIDIPRNVHSIGNHAFYGCSSLLTIKMTNGVYRLGTAVFAHCTDLAYARLSDNIVYVPEELFMGCSSLNKVEMPDTVKTIGAKAFKDCNMLHIFIFPTQLVAINDCAFENCTFSELLLPQGLESISSNAFRGCAFLRDISIPASLAYLDTNAFFSCPSLMNITVDQENRMYSSEDGILYDHDKEYLILYPIDALKTSYTVPATVKSIGAYGFSRNKHLETVFLKNVENIGENAFKSSFLLRLIDMPNVISLGAGAFSNCYKLEVISLFQVKIIPENAFFNCSSLKSVKLADATVSIKNNAFQACCNLSKIELPDTLVSLGDFSFSQCKELKNIWLPKHLSLLGEQVFSQSTSLEIIEVHKDNQEYTSKDGILFNYNFSMLIKYPEGKKDIKYTLPASTLYLLNYSISNAKALSEITFSPGLQRIEVGAFKNASILQFDLPNSLQKIEAFAFEGCSLVTEITIPASVMNVSENAFKKMKSLQRINVSSNNKFYSSDENGVFYNSTKTRLIRYPPHLKKYSRFEIPQGVTTISDGAFEGNIHLSMILVGASITEIYDRFESCEQLDSIKVDPYNPNYVSIDNVLYQKNEDSDIFDESISMIRYPEQKYLSGYSIPPGVARFSPSAFSSNKFLRTLDLSTSEKLETFEDSFYISAIENTSISTIYVRDYYYDYLNSFNLPVNIKIKEREHIFDDFVFPKPEKQRLMTTEDIIIIFCACFIFVFAICAAIGYYVHKKRTGKKHSSSSFLFKDDVIYIP